MVCTFNADTLAVEITTQYGGVAEFVRVSGLADYAVYRYLTGVRQPSFSAFMMIMRLFPHVPLGAWVVCDKGTKASGARVDAKG